jgi:hypothetical protein
MVIFFYSIVVDRLYALIGFVFYFSGFNLCTGLSSLWLLLSCLEIIGVALVVDICYTSVVSAIPICTNHLFGGPTNESQYK